jgi:inhibitor of cysteine peptidase
MDDKFILMDLNDERSAKIAEVLKNKTCKKIIDYLGEVKEASEKEISDATGVAMNTVGYNIKNLMKVGLVEKTHNFFWSVKGRKINLYKLAKKHIVISPTKKPNLSYLKSILPVIVFVLGLLIVVSMINFEDVNVQEGELLRFESGDDLIKAFENAQGQGNFGRNVKSFGIEEGMVQDAGTNSDSSVSYSETNIQVAGVDEADIIKTDGEYIYAIANGKLIIARAYPVGDAEILSVTEFDDFSGSEIFIDDDRLLIFGRSVQEISGEVFENEIGFVAERYYPRFDFTSVKLFDVSDRDEPGLLRSFDFEGNYLTSRKINSDVYFVINSYPRFYKDKPCLEIVPQYSEDDGEMMPIAKCVDIGYVEPIQAQNFVTIVSISMSDENKEIVKEVVVGSGQNVYASLENLYIAQTSWPVYNRGGLVDSSSKEKTVVSKFNLDKGKIEFVGNGEVKGHILNQFSMDEYEGKFRIATTVGAGWNSEKKSVNNVYVLNSELEVVGELEDLAPGESIYSVRFMGEKGYVVTFKKIDPLFVIDFSEDNPVILGKLKIPGYSDYLHPYDENHIIGIGKDAVEAEGEFRDFAWYQGVKMALFDVSDVENPVELHKVIIGDRGTDSEALHNHKAFLFDRSKELLVLPITLAEIKGEKSSDNQYGDFVFQGVYVYDLSLEEGFDLKGRVSHYEDSSVFDKSGYYFRSDANVRRSLYIGDVLYTFSNKKIGMNLLEGVEDLGGLIW